MFIGALVNVCSFIVYILIRCTCTSASVCMCVCIHTILSVNKANNKSSSLISNYMQNCGIDTLERIAYTSRQLNSTNTSLQFFNLLILFGLEQIEEVKAALLKCFDSTEIAYAYNKSAQPGQFRKWVTI